MTTQDILEIAARCEAATGPDTQLDALIWCAINDLEPWQRVIDDFERGQATRYTASLDAAMTLVPEGLRRVEFGTYDAGGAWAYVWSVPTDEKGEADAATEALALTAASLKARAHTKGEK